MAPCTSDNINPCRLIGRPITVTVRSSFIMLSRNTRWLQLKRRRKLFLLANIKKLLSHFFLKRNVKLFLLGNLFIYTECLQCEDVLQKESPSSKSQNRILFKSYFWFMRPNFSFLPNTLVLKRRSSVMVILAFE